MLRLIFIVVVLFCAFVGGLAFALNHWFGWKGMVAFPVILLVVLWVGKTVLVSLFKNFALGLFSRKAGALRGANLQVHSVAAVSAPPDSDEDEAADDETDEEATVGEGEDDSENENQAEDDEPADDEPEEAREWFDLDLTITPTEENKERLWEPGEFVLTSEAISKLDQLEDKEVGCVATVLVWKNSGFVSDEVGKYPGTQRLKLTVSVKPGIQKAWLQYYNLSLGPIALPLWNPLSPTAVPSTSATL